MKKISRRSFLDRSVKTIVAFPSAVALMGVKQHAKADKANDKIIMGVIGLGGRGRDHAQRLAQREDVALKYVCDVDEVDRIGNMPKRMTAIQKSPCQGVTDMRRIYDDKEVDAVLIATTDHWHALATIWACQAGKDVYVEKPPSICPWEGRKMVEAARKYNCVVQVGTQNRSAAYIKKAAHYIKEGGLGEIPLVKVYNLKSGMPFICPPDSDVPKGVNYDMYLGPAPSRAFNRAHFHDGWKKFWAYSEGDMGDDGIHQLDVARFILGDKAYPKAVNCSGGHIAFKDDREVPDTQVVSYEYDNQIVTYEMSEWAPYMIKIPAEIRDGNAFPYWPTCSTRIEVYGTKGLMYLGRHGGGWQVLVKYDGKIGEQEFGQQANEEHRSEFLECVRSRRMPSADIETGYQSALLVHLANIGVRLGGRRLEFDSVTEKFIGDEEANALLKRSFRDPYIIPDQV
ncbi:MAG TPA: Gfo/Idh/MocA family oxidoreductase [Candidatus Hydrogenedentes bacterium]|nr:Gfo/Idh/MocA family oxidoreductase [Candidatus Hydrogenedentota bacterium]